MVTIAPSRVSSMSATSRVTSRVSSALGHPSHQAVQALLRRIALSDDDRSKVHRGDVWLRALCERSSEEPFFSGVKESGVISFAVTTLRIHGYRLGGKDGRPVFR